MEVLIRTVVLDIETNRLHNPDRIWLVVCKDLSDGTVSVFKEPDRQPKELLDYLANTDRLVMHNGLGFDHPTLSRLVSGYKADVRSIFDTLVVSRLINYNLPDGHSLDSWGERLGDKKGRVSSYDALTEELIAYCIQDVEVTTKLYNYLLEEIDLEQWQDAIDTEHITAHYCQQMHETGFAFDIEGATKVHGEIVNRLEKLDKEIIGAFKPKAVLLREITPVLTAHGTLHKKDFKWLERGSSGELDLTPYSAGSSFCLFTLVPFNPGSTVQIVERLNEAGWKPTEKTKGHIAFERTFQRAPHWRKKELEADLAEWRIWGWKVSEENLATLPPDAPKAAQLLKERLILDARRSTFVEWFNAYDPSTQRVHGTINHIGAWTQRCSHAKPNIANIVRLQKGKDKIPIPGFAGGYGLEMRSSWIAPKGRRLVGVDADGIQLRVLAHYMEDDRFTEALVNGRSEDGTDAHSLNQRALGPVCKSRDLAKTFIYSWLLGAGAAKTASILDCSLGEAKQARDRFLAAYPGLEELREVTIPQDAKRGFFCGVDGRLVPQTSEHLMLSGYLQCGEAVVMKKAMSLWIPKLEKEKIDFKLVDFVHDEWVIECPDDDAVCNFVLSTAAMSINLAGEALNLKCPMKGNGKIGQNWADIH